MDKPPIQILLVEDNPADVVLLEAALEGVAPAAFQVTAVEQIGAALACLAARSFAVALLDLGLPDSQGLATFTRLHAQAPDLPVVVLSGLQDAELAAAAVRAGAQDYLVKDQARDAELVRVIRYAIERHQLQAQLRAREQYFRALIEHSADAVVTLSADGTIGYASPAAAPMLGIAPVDLVGQQACALLHPDDQPASVAILARLREEPHAPCFHAARCRCADGSWGWVEGTATSLLDVPGVQAIVVNYRDVTARKQAEDALRELNETLELRVAARTAELRQANAELARAARLKDEFLATMSHELRTPLSNILGRVELLQEAIHGSLTPEQSRDLRNIEASGRHLLTLINEILDLSKIEAGKFQLTCEPVHVDQVCYQSLQMVAERAVRKRLALSTTGDPAVTTILADERRLLQILVNLLTNAITFTPEGGAVGLEVRGYPAQQRVTFTVWDTGIGIAEADLSRLFQPFTQLDSGLNRQYGGTGLGLTLVLRLVQAHQGSVAVTSQPGQGSRFSVSLPWTTTPVELAAGAPATPARPKVPALRPSAHGAIQPAGPGVREGYLPSGGPAHPAILLVEDHAQQAELMVAYLEAHGYQLRVAQNGGDALILARDERPALVLMDIQLPGMDGLTAIRRMRAEPALDAVPILALTALALPGDRERCLAAGADAYLAKPVSLRTLLDAIQTHLDRYAEEVGAAPPIPEAG